MTTNSNLRGVPPQPTDAPSETFRRTLIKVMSVQVVTLLVLWLLHARYTS